MNIRFSQATRKIIMIEKEMDLEVCSIELLQYKSATQECLIVVTMLTT